MKIKIEKEQVGKTLVSTERIERNGKFYKVKKYKVKKANVGSLYDQKKKELESL